MVASLCFGKPIDVVAGIVEHKVSLNDLPDEILILIFNRLLDLKCLCLCSLVSPRFSSLILLHVHSVSFAIPRPTPSYNTLSKRLLGFFHRLVFGSSLKVLPSIVSYFYSGSFRSAGYFLSKFKSIRSLHLILPACPNKLSDSLVFKWTAKFGPTTPTIDTLVFLYASSIEATNVDQEQEEDYSELTANKLRRHIDHLTFTYICDATVRHRMLLFFIEEHPLLQDITIIDSMNQGNLSLRGSKLVEMRDWIKSELKNIYYPFCTDFKNQDNLSLKDSRLADIRNWINSARRKIYLLLKEIELPVSWEEWHVPMLELPVSGKVMKNATLVSLEMVDHHHLRRELDSDAAAIANLFGKGEEEFGEALVEMMVNHQSVIKSMFPQALTD